MSDDRTSPSATERIRVEVIEWARGNPAPIESVLETVELSLDDTIIFLAPFVDDGYTILVQKVDGTVLILHSVAELPRDARSMSVIRVMRPMNRTRRP